MALDVLCDPNIKVVTLTVTQKGYCHDPATGTLDFKRNDIQECLSNMDEPSTAVGYIVTALERRMNAGAPPLTVISCDNMPANGTVLRNVVLAYAAQKSANLRRYIEERIRFPSTMVDRIVPKTTPENIFNSSANGIKDEWPIVTERFRQWVIEDSFSGEVPDFASAGVTVAKNVEPFELMKLRMLNGAHMALGCIGRLAGYKTVGEAVNDPQVFSFICAFMEEAAATVPHIDGVDFTLYQQQLIKRLQNPHMKDELSRLARNGSQKIDGRILDTLRDAKAHNLDCQHLAFATAAWIQYLKGYDDHGDVFDITDEHAVESGLQEIARNSNGSPEPVITASGLFNHDLIRDEAFIDAVSYHLHNIQREGAVNAFSMIEANARSVKTLNLQNG